jgi:hypothetical protein
MRWIEAAAWPVSMDWPLNGAPSAHPKAEQRESKLVGEVGVCAKALSCLELTDVLQVKIGRHRGAAHISSRTKARTTKRRGDGTAIASRGGNKRKYALADINADVANKRLFVRQGPPPTGGSPPPLNPSPPTREGTTSLTLTLTPTPMGSTTRRNQRQQQHQQHQQHRLPPRHSLGGGSRPQRSETGRWNPIRCFVRAVRGPWPLARSVLHPPYFKRLFNR